MRTGGVSTYSNPTGYRVTLCFFLDQFFPLVIPALLDVPEDLYYKPGVQSDLRVE